MAERNKLGAHTRSLANLTRSRQRAHNGALDLRTTKDRFAFSTGFDTTKYIEAFYSSNPISAAPEQREELKLRRELCSTELKKYVTDNYEAFIATTATVVSIESDMLKLNNLFGQFQLGLRSLQGASSAFHYEDEKLHAKLKAIEAASSSATAGHSSSAEGLLGAASSGGSGAASGGQHPAEVELEELCEELRGLIYERKFDAALSTLETAQSKVRSRARELDKQGGGANGAGGNGGGVGSGSGSSNVSGFDNLPNSPMGGASSGWGSGGGALASSSGSGGIGGPNGNGSGGVTPFQQLTLDLLSLRQTLIEMLFSEVRSAAAANQGGIGGRGGGATSPSASSNKGGKRSGSSAAVPAAAASSASSFQLSRVIMHLLTLRQSRRALQVFLYVVKSAHIKSSIRAIKFSGDIVAYIAELSARFFGGILQATQEFQRLFRQQADYAGASDNNASSSSTASSTTASAGGANDTVDNPHSLSSYFLRWVLHELLHTFNAIFQKQVFQSEGTFQKLGKCIKYAFQQCAILEGRSSSNASSSLSSPLIGGGGTGLNLSFVLSRMFTPSLVEVISSNYRHVEQLIAEELAVEVWRVSELWVTEKERGNKQQQQLEDERGRGRRASAAEPPAPVVAKKKRALKLTSSAKYLYDVVRNLLRELVPILDVHGSSNSSVSSGGGGDGSNAGGVSWSVSTSPSTRVELYPVVVSGMQGLLEGFLMAMVQELKLKLFVLDENQALSIMANAFYLHQDLVPRVIKEFRKHFGGATGTGSNSSSSGSSGTTTTAPASSIPELEEFNARLHKLYLALRSSFCLKRASMLWPFERFLCLPSKMLGGANKYANPMGIGGLGASSGESASVSGEWGNFADNYLPALHQSVGRCINPGEVEPVLTLALEELMETLLEGHFGPLGALAPGKDGASAAASAVPGASALAAAASGICVWDSYLFGLGGLQQFDFDVKFLVRSCGGRLNGASIAASAAAGSSSSSSNRNASTARWDTVSSGGFITSRAASSCSALLSRCILSYSERTATEVDEEWCRTHLGWVDAAVEKRVGSAKQNLAKAYAADKEKERLEKVEREKEAHAAKQALKDRQRELAQGKMIGGSSSAAGAAGSSSSGAPSLHASSSVAAPRSGVRRGSTITPEQLALMREVAGGGGAAAANAAIADKLAASASPLPALSSKQQDAAAEAAPLSVREKERERERRRKARQQQEEEDEEDE